MNIRDLGQLDGPILVFGGPYSNLQATKALLAVARSEAIAPDHLICTGDVVAYCAAPSETIAAVRDAGCTIVAGNCEKQLAAYEDHCGCGFEEGTACDLLSAGWYAHANSCVTQADREWMAQLPDIVSFDHKGVRMAVIHGGLTDVSRFLWPTSSNGMFHEEISEIQKVIPDASWVLAGHSGLPFEREVGAQRWINAGVIGMPPHDGSAQTAYVILRDGKAEFHRLSYDYQTAANRMRQVGLTQGYERALLTGYWPSEEVLPPELRRAPPASG